MKDLIKPLKDIIEQDENFRKYLEEQKKKNNTIKIGDVYKYFDIYDDEKLWDVLNKKLKEKKLNKTNIKQNAKPIIKELKKPKNKKPKNKKPKNKKPKNKNLKTLLISLSIGLTLISLTAGFQLYKALFGIYVAILISVIFETLRLTTLFQMKSYKQKGFVFIFAILLYIIVASSCFFAAILSFNYQIEKTFVQKQSIINKQKQKEMFEIKQNMLKNIKTKINEIEKHKDLMLQRIAKYPNSNYYKSRIEQDNKKLRSLKIQKENIIKLNINNYNEINSYKAMYNIKDNNYDIDEKDAVKTSIKNFLKIDIHIFEKLIGIILSIVIEFGIILLALISFKEV